MWLKTGKIHGSVLATIAIVLQVTKSVVADFDSPDTEIGQNSCNIPEATKMKDFTTKDWPWLTDVELNRGTQIKLHLPDNVGENPTCTTAGHEARFHKRPDNSGQYIAIWCSNDPQHVTSCCRNSIAAGYVDHDQPNPGIVSYTMTPCISE